MRGIHAKASLGAEYGTAGRSIAYIAYTHDDQHGAGAKHNNILERLPDMLLAVIEVYNRRTMGLGKCTIGIVA